jgi:3-oxoacyl-[acyl-carrier-protein] synthase II
VSKRRVVVTGLGIVSPVGSDVATAWAAILAGKSGIKPITRIDATPFATRFAGEVIGFDVAQYIAPKEARRMDPFMHYGMGAGIQAVADSGVDFGKEDGTRAGAIMGSGIGGLAGIEEEAISWERTHNPKKTSPFYIPSTIGNMVAGHLSIRFGLKGPNLGVVSACTTSTHAIGFGMRCIQYGDADIIIAGGSECATTPTALAGFSQARALSERNDDPAAASRPWDKDRDGFVMGDGGGAVILEELEHARARGWRWSMRCVTRT